MSSRGKKRGRAIKVKVESKQSIFAGRNKRRSVSASLGQSGMRLVRAGAMQFVQPRVRRARRVSKRISKIQQQCKDLKKRFNKDVHRATFLRPATALPSLIGRELGYFDMDNGLMDWSTISSTPPARTAGLPERYAFNNQLLYLTPQIYKGDSLNQREGDSINWRHTTVKCKIQLPERNGSTTRRYTSYKVRFVVFKFTGLKGTPIKFNNHSSGTKNYPRQRDLWELIYELYSTATGWAENSFRKDCASFRRRVTDKPSPCSIIYDRSYDLPYQDDKRKVHDLRIKLNHGNGLTVKYDQVAENQNPIWSPESPLGPHYFLAAYVQQPLRIKDDTSGGNNIVDRAPSYTLNGAQVEMRVEATMSITHRFDC